MVGARASTRLSRTGLRRSRRRAARARAWRRLGTPASSNNRVTSAISGSSIVWHSAVRSTSDCSRWTTRSGPRMDYRPPSATEKGEKARLTRTGPAEEGRASPPHELLDLGIGGVHRLGLET